MASSWAAEENCCIHCKQCDIQQGFGPRTFILCACCQDRGSHVECEEKASGKRRDLRGTHHLGHQIRRNGTSSHIQHLLCVRRIFLLHAGLTVSVQALEAGKDWFCSQVQAGPFRQSSMIAPARPQTQIRLQECRRVSLGLAARTSQGRMPFPGDTAYSSELVKYNPSCKGETTASHVLCQASTLFACAKC